jgi:hypothetical protein
MGPKWDPPVSTAPKTSACLMNSRSTTFTSGKARDSRPERSLLKPTCSSEGSVLIALVGVVASDRAAAPQTTKTPAKLRHGRSRAGKTSSRPEPDGPEPGSQSSVMPGAGLEKLCHCRSPAGKTASRPGPGWQDAVPQPHWTPVHISLLSLLPEWCCPFPGTMAPQKERFSLQPPAVLGPT